LTNEIAAIDRQSFLIDEEVAGLEVLLGKGLAPRPRLLALQRQQSQLLGTREGLSAQVATTEIEIGEARIELNQLTEGFREDVLTQIRDVQTQASELIEQRVAAIDELERLLILAPRSGRVIGVRAHTVGGIIAPRDPIMHVVPEGDTLIARVRISPSDIDKVSPGSEAILRFPAFSANVTPEVYGSVSSVSADALQDVNTGQFYFEGILEIPADRLSNQEFVLVPGMPVDASLKTKSRTVISYLLKPLFDAMSKTFRE
jgi:HlyD family type I secretion membrane fusion protein